MKRFTAVIALCCALHFAPVLAQTAPVPVVAVSKTAEESHYVKWLRRANPGVTCINMYTLPADSIEAVMGRCAGLLLTGGSDVVPALYGKAHEAKKCEDFDVKRDSLELRLIRIALRRKMPVLGICRGEQILNVAKGGSLITDIPSDIGKKVSHRNDTMAWHHIRLRENSLLYRICGVKEGMVNSAHHQCVDRIARDFAVSAAADDGVPEAYELNEAGQLPFLLGVQWHPERMPAASPLSAPLASYFIGKVLEYAVQQR
jgi:putative glutamine amidotransferase